MSFRFPAEIVAVDVSGKHFHRMSLQRRSMTTGEIVNRTVDGADTVRRRGRTRRPRNRLVFVGLIDQNLIFIVFLRNII